MAETSKNCRELMSEAGYNLYKCGTEEEIQYFKRYYEKGEELCTFTGGRLERCEVFFAVKKDVENIKRKDFTNPQRQDKYGTSVISIQFTKDGSNTLSIKNRYNHTVANPDSTFSNDLENIIPGLTLAFAKEYGLQQKNQSRIKFELPGYVIANDGKYYPYNIEKNNIYYCPGNIIIDNFEVKRYPQEKYIVFEQFILDLKTGEIKCYDSNSKDCFPDSIIDPEKVQVIKEDKIKKITISIPNKENIELKINENGRLLTVKNPNVVQIGDNFLINAYMLENVDLENVKIVGDAFLNICPYIKELNTPLLEITGDNFCSYCDSLEKVNISNLRKTGDYCLQYCKLTELNFQNLEEVGNDFFGSSVSSFDSLEFPKLRQAGDNFFRNLVSLKKIDIPNLEIIGDNFSVLYCNELNLKKLKKAGNGFLRYYISFRNSSIVNLESLETVGEGSFNSSEELKNAFLSGKLRKKYIITNLLKNLPKLLNSKLQNINFLNRGVEDETTKHR